MKLQSQITSAPTGIPRDMPATLLTVIHTEEEFDWSKPFDRSRTGIQHIKQLGNIQKVFEKHGVKPTYLMDYPVASSDLAKNVFSDLLQDEQCEIGAHLHPWVSPPNTEEVCDYNSYPGNLPKELEAKKLQLLTSEIERQFSLTPRTYLAGRYGFGPNTAKTLVSLQYTVDLSLVPTYNYTGDGGPDYSAIRSHTHWEGENLGLLRIPHTAAYIGALSHNGLPGLTRFLYPGPIDLLALRALGKARLLRRVRLSPEGSDVKTMKKLTRYLYRDGVRVFVFSFHSPSIVPGNTPYVQTKQQQIDFIRKIDEYLDFFSSGLNGEFSMPQALLARLTS